MLIRATLNKKLAEDLKYTSSVNEKLVNHYRNYPEAPEGVANWSNTLNRYLTEAFTKFL